MRDAVWLTVMFISELFNKISTKVSVSPIFIFVIIFFVAADLVFVVLHFYLGQNIHAFNIDLERNAPTLYQGFKLVFTGCVVAAYFYLLNTITRQSLFNRLIIFPYWLGFIYLAMDETAEIHENFAGVLNRLGGDAVTNYREYFANLGYTSAQWLLFFVPIIIFALGYLFYLAKHFHKQNAPQLVLFILAVTCFALVPLVEWWNTAEFSYHYSFTQRNILVTLEEYLEMLGATLFFAFNVGLLSSVTKRARQRLQNLNLL